MQLQSGSFVVDAKNCLYKNLTSGTNVLIKSGLGYLQGVTVNSHTSGQIKFADDVTVVGAQLITGTIYFASGERYVNLGGVTFGTGCVAVVHNADVTIHYC